MKKNNIVAMILAGGRGSRLYDLTKTSQSQLCTMEVNTG